MRNPMVMSVFFPGLTVYPNSKSGPSPSLPSAGRARPSKPVVQKSISAEDCSEELLDIVEICNEAKRAGVGDLIWASWDSSHWTARSKKMKPTFVRS